MNKPKIIAIFIAYKAEKTVKNFWENLPKEYFDEAILVDDTSKDKTFEIAKKLPGLIAYQNPINLGYGGNLKKAIGIALKHGADIIIDIHPDDEYKPSAIPLALNKIEKEDYELILGNRFLDIKKTVKAGMFIWKVIPLLTLNYIDKLILGLKISDLHQGFRVYTKKFLEKVNYLQNSNNYLFSFELITQARFKNIKIGEVPVEVSYKGKKRGASLKNSFKYTLGTFKILGLYLLAKLGFKTKIFK